MTPGSRISEQKELPLLGNGQIYMFSQKKIHTTEELLEVVFYAIRVV
jgi:hypothetical protein